MSKKEKKINLYELTPEEALKYETAGRKDSGRRALFQTIRNHDFFSMSPIVICFLDLRNPCS